MGVVWNACASPGVRGLEQGSPVCWGARVWKGACGVGEPFLQVNKASLENVPLSGSDSEGGGEKRGDCSESMEVHAAASVHREPAEVPSERPAGELHAAHLLGHASALGEFFPAREAEQRVLCPVVHGVL